MIAGFLFPPAPAMVDGLRQLSRRLASVAAKPSSKSPDPPFAPWRGASSAFRHCRRFSSGLGVMVAGIPAATLITSAALILGIVQIGPSIVILPLVIWSWTAMETTTALLFTVYMIPVSLLDNVLRPLALAQWTRIPRSWSFCSALLEAPFRWGSPVCF